jgi:arylsulfatase A-like enzyme
VSHVDLFPTILDVLGEKIPTSLPGHSLRAPAANTETVFSESFPCDMLVSLNPRFRRVERAAFSGPFKLILATNGKREFYDLSQDPHEEHNLYSQNLPAASRLEHELRQWISRLPAERSRPAVMDKSGVDRLKSLGYVQ